MSMYLDNKNTVKLSELIYWVKQELLSDEARRNDPVPLFVIDEVTVEVNFVLAGKGSGGFDVVIAKANAEVAEERVQKATVRMKSLIPYDELVAEYKTKHPQERKQSLNDSLKVLLKGSVLENESEAVPPVE